MNINMKKLTYFLLVLLACMPLKTNAEELYPYGEVHIFFRPYTNINLNTFYRLAHIPHIKGVDIFRHVRDPKLDPADYSKPNTDNEYVDDTPPKEKTRVLDGEMDKFISALVSWNMMGDMKIDKNNFWATKFGVENPNTRKHLAVVYWPKTVSSTKYFVLDAGSPKFEKKLDQLVSNFAAQYRKQSNRPKN